MRACRCTPAAGLSLGTGDNPSGAQDAWIASDSVAPSSGSTGSPPATMGRLVSNQLRHVRSRRHVSTAITPLVPATSTRRSCRRQPRLAYWVEAEFAIRIPSPVSTQGFGNVVLPCRIRTSKRVFRPRTKTGSVRQGGKPIQCVAASTFLAVTEVTTTHSGIWSTSMIPLISWSPGRGGSRRRWPPSGLRCGRGP